MGFFRKFGLVLVIILFTLSLFLGNLIWTVSSSLDYDNVKSNGVTIIEEVVASQTGVNLSEEIENHKYLMEEYCKLKGDYSFEYEGYEIEISCDDINLPSNTILEDNFEKLFSEIYYKEYSCSFWNCFKEEAIPLFLISQKAKDYWTEKFYLVFAVSLILLGASFLLFKRKRNFFIFSGVLMILIAIPFANLQGLIPLENVIIISVLKLFISSSEKVFLTGLVTGISFLVFGILLYISGINKFFKKIFGFMKSKKVQEKTSKKKKKESKNKKKELENNEVDVE